MATVEELRLEIKAEVKDALAKLKQVERQSYDTGRGASELGKVFASLRDVMQGPVAAARMVVGAFQEVVKVGKELYNEYAEAERGQIVFAQAMKDSGNISSDGASRLREYAEELQQLTGADADNTQAIMGNLAAMGKSEAQIKDLIEAASNYAAATGIDLDTAVKQLNSTLQGNVGMLGRQNLAVKSLTTEQLKNGDAIKIINEQYKGMAEAVGKSAMGAAERLNANVGDLKEALGEVVAYKFGPLIENMVNAAKEAADKIKANTNIGKVLSGDVDSLDATRQAMIDIQNEINSLNESAFTTYGQYKKAKEALEQGYAELKKIHSTQLEIATAAEKERDAAQKAAGAEESKRKAQEKAAIEAAQIEERNRINGSARLDTWHSLQAAGEGYFQWLAAQEEEAQKTQSENDRARLATWEAMNQRGAGIDLFSLGNARDAAGKAPNIEDWSGFQEKINKMWAETTPKGDAWDEYIKKLQEVQTEEEKMVELAEILGSAMQSAFEGVGAALVTGEDGFKAFGKAGLQAIGAIIEGFAKQYAALAIAEFFTPGMQGAAAGHAIAAAGLYTAAGAVKAIPLEKGGIIKARPGGTLARIGEGGQDEAVIPLKRGRGLGITIVQNIAGNVWNTKQLRDMAVDAVATAQLGW